jgi:hypothetical protein
MYKKKIELSRKVGSLVDTSRRIPYSLRTVWTPPLFPYALATDMAKCAMIRKGWITSCGVFLALSLMAQTVTKPLREPVRKGVSRSHAHPFVGGEKLGPMKFCRRSISPHKFLYPGVAEQGGVCDFLRPPFVPSLSRFICDGHPPETVAHTLAGQEYFLVSVLKRSVNSDREKTLIGSTINSKNWVMRECLHVIVWSGTERRLPSNTVGIECAMA